MNWKSAALKLHRWQVLILGGIAGFWGVLIYEGAGYLQEYLSLPGAYSVLPAAALGFGLGIFISPIDELLHRHIRRSVKSALAGSVLGFLLGGIGFGTVSWLTSGQGYSLLEILDSNQSLLEGLYFPAGLGLIGAAIGGSSAIAAGDFGKMTRRLLRGLAVGVVVSLPLTYLMSTLPQNLWVFLTAMVIWSALLALSLFWWEKRFAKRWFRLLTAPGEDAIFPLRKHDITLGKLENNHIPLMHYQEIYPYHCLMTWVSDHYEIVDNEQGGMVQVNYRNVQEQPLKSGDLVKIGSALLQYGEAK